MSAEAHLMWMYKSVWQSKHVYVQYSDCDSSVSILLGHVVSKMSLCINFSLKNCCIKAISHSQSCGYAK